MELSNDIYSWQLNTRLLKIILDIRDTQENINENNVSLNVGIIMISAIVIESIVSYCLYYSISKFGVYHLGPREISYDCNEPYFYEDFLNYDDKNGSKELFQKRVQDNLKKRVQKASWSQLDELSNIILGKKLNEFYLEKWDGIKVLFSMRNLISHGEFLKVIRYLNESSENCLSVDNIEIHGRKGISDFLMKEKLITVENVKISENIIFNNKVANYFIKHSLTFIKSFLAEIDSHGDGMSLLVKEIEQFLKKLSYK